MLHTTSVGALMPAAWQFGGAPGAKSRLPWEAEGCCVLFLQEAQAQRLAVEAEDCPAMAELRLGSVGCRSSVEEHPWQLAWVGLVLELQRDTRVKCLARWMQQRHLDVVEEEYRRCQAGPPQR